MQLREKGREGETAIETFKKERELMKQIVRPGLHIKSDCM